VKFGAGRTIYRCREHEEVPVPLHELLREGKLSLYPAVSEHSYFDIEYRRAELVLRASRYVGLIPISDQIAIHVEPKAPIGNLLYIIWRAGCQLTGLPDFTRTYADRPGAVDTPEALYLNTFVSTARDVLRQGLRKRYQTRVTDAERRGRVLVNKTVSRFLSRGYRHKQVFEVCELSTNNCENQILKHSLQRLLAYVEEQLNSQNRTTAQELRELLVRLNTVDCRDVHPQRVARMVFPVIRSLPARYHFYEPALWLAYLIAAKSGIIMEDFGKLRFQTLIIDVSDAFEGYARAICRDNTERLLGGCAVRDGNERPVSLFVNGPTKCEVRPDMYFEKGGHVLGAADVKYKANPNTQDRYELIAFCEALRVNKAAFICPRVHGEDLVVHHGTTPRGISLYVIRIDLSDADMPAEEERFCSSLAKTLGLR